MKISKAATVRTKHDAPKHCGGASCPSSVRCVCACSRCSRARRMATAKKNGSRLGRPPLGGEPVNVRIDDELLRRVEERQEEIARDTKVGTVSRSDVLRSLIIDGLALADKEEAIRAAVVATLQAKEVLVGHHQDALIDRLQKSADALSSLVVKAAK